MQRLYIGLFIILCLHVCTSVAQESDQAVLFGHNLTPTSYTLHRHETTIGYYVLGYGITENWTVATCPWIDYFYNMPMINTKYNFLATENYRITVDLNYFKTFQFAENLYEQTSFFGRLVGSDKFSSLYTLHTSFGYQYFWDDAKTYSLFLTPDNGERYTLSLSALNEFHWTKHFGNFIEVGVLGMNYEVPFYQLGLSFFYTWDWGMVQLGASQSISFRPLAYSLTVGTSSPQTEYGTLQATHPEVQLQFYF
jgi:hypothetical protein